MKKKYSATITDKKNWLAFTKQTKRVYDKDTNFAKQNTEGNNIKKLDLHGFSLDEANKIIKKFINESFEKGNKRLLIITGKGSRSKVHKNPYLSKKMNVLKYSVPEFIKNDEDLSNKINKMSNSDLKNGEKGAFYIFLKRKKNL